MSMYILNSRTFFETFLKEKPDKILKAQYVIVSSRIRKSKKYDNIISGSNILYPDQNILSHTYKSSKMSDLCDDDDEFKNSYINQLKESRAFLATLIKGSIEEQYKIIFICSRNEWKNFKYLQILAEFIWDEFGYPVYDYKKIKNRSQTIIAFNTEEVIRHCNKVLKKASDKKIKEMSSTVDGRIKMVKQMSKDEMKEKLKAMHLYTGNMSKSEMIEMLELFFVKAD